MRSIDYPIFDFYENNFEVHSTKRKNKWPINSGNRSSTFIRIKVDITLFLPSSAHLYNCNEERDNKAILMTCGKSPPSDLILEKIKSNNSQVFKENLERELSSFLSKLHFVVFLHVYFSKQGKTQQSKSLYFNNIVNCQFYK